MNAFQPLEIRQDTSTAATQREAELEAVRRAIAESWEEDCPSDPCIDLSAPFRQGRGSTHW